MNVMNTADKIRNVVLYILLMHTVQQASNTLCPTHPYGWNVIYKNREKLPEYKKEYTEKEVNPHNFKLLHKPEKCRSGDVVLVAINSAAQYIHRRKLLRLTWASEKVLTEATAFKFNFKIIFVLGVPEDKKLKRFIKYESEVYGDLLLVDFKDNYCNNTYKSIYNMKWCSMACAGAVLILKADDDLLIDIYQLGSLISKEIDPIHNTKHFLLGNFLGDMPHRNQKSKWYLSPAEYPYSRFPKWYQGLAFTLSPNLAERIYSLSFTTPYLFADDVYVGLVADRVEGIYRKDINTYYCDHTLNDVKSLVRKCVNDNKLFYHLPVYESYMYVWRAITKIDLYSLS